MRRASGRARSPGCALRWLLSASCRMSATCSPSRPGRMVSRCRSSSAPVRWQGLRFPLLKPTPNDLLPTDSQNKHVVVGGD
jgi:hypothetical protein